MRRAVIGLLMLTGCAATAPSRPRVVLLGAQLRQQDEALVGETFRTLLDFEHPADAAFVRTGVAGQGAGHTGARSLRAGPAASVNVSSLLFGLTLPADFTLLGGYVRPAAGGRVSATLFADEREVARTTRDVPAGAWAFAAIDLTPDACRAALPSAKAVKLRFDVDGAGDFLLDDVLLVNNRRPIVSVPGVWAVTPSGLSLDVVFADRARLTIPTLAAGASGWAVDETSAVRLRLHDAAGRAWTLLADGRSITDGRPGGPAAAVDVDAATGRLDRETPGDADNDGYNEQRAAYQVTATGPRLRIRVSPAGAAFASPVFEIRGLPPQSGVVTVSGRLIDRTARLPDGTLLVMLPARIEAPVEVTVGVSGE